MSVHLRDLPTVVADRDELRRARVVRSLTRRVRDEGVSSHVIAEMAGIDPTTVTGLIRGRVKGKPSTIDRVERALDGHWTRPNTADHVNDMRRCLNRFLSEKTNHRAAA